MLGLETSEAPACALPSGSVALLPKPWQMGKGGVMPHFFFDLVRGSERIFDEVGIELYAHELDPALINELLQALWHEQDCPDWSGWSIEILDEAGVPTLRLAFNSPS